MIVSFTVYATLYRKRKHRLDRCSSRSILFVKRTRIYTNMHISIVFVYNISSLERIVYYYYHHCTSV